tara:strand:- start:86 stop:379 length:294 start_codon:yes stop_codon:yes gene_type:complete
MVHAAERNQFVHLRIVPTIDLDEEAVMVVGEEMLNFRVSVGHASNVMTMKFDVVNQPTSLIDNLWVEMGEEVWVSTSHPKHFLLFGFTSTKAMRPCA